MLALDLVEVRGEQIEMRVNLGTIELVLGSIKLYI